MLRGAPGDQEAAEAALAAAEDAAKSPLQMKILSVCRGRAGEEEALVGATKNWGRCIAFYYLGVRALVDGRDDDAKRLFQRCQRTNAHKQFEFRLALAHLRKLGAD